MKTDTAIALALAGIALWMILTPRKAAASGAAAGSSSYGTLLHPADAYAGTWTASGPMVPGTYDKQIWD